MPDSGSVDPCPSSELIIRNHRATRKGASLSKSCSSKVRITNRYGLHARPATDFAQAANEFSSDIRVRCEDEDADGKSVMELMMLAATQGTELEVICIGDDAKDALEHLASLVNRGFDEDEDE